ncbi:hypothetical protein [Kutzneria sp. 744]|uniref:hypothetical protein n=1 Tax=Kutzneria sp. (strain 744) TaxID=345341 RepID=UPI0012FA7BE0|nr:hypothetical protein [Kutzneria sp. 744]
MIAMHDDQPTALAIAATEAAALLTLMCEGRDDMVPVVDLTARIYVIPAPTEIGLAGDAGTGAGATMLLFAGAAALATASRIPCAGPGSVAILHTSAQIDDLVADLAEVLSCVAPPAGP